MGEICICMGECICVKCVFVYVVVFETDVFFILVFIKRATFKLA